MRASSRSAAPLGREPPIKPPEQVVIATEVTDSKLCSVVGYRSKTSFHSLNPEKPYLYVNEEKIGRLSIGESVCLHLPSGKYSISIKEPLLFMPTFTSGRIEVEIPASSLVYLRYSKEFAGVITTGSNTVVTGNSKLQVATEEQWNFRQ